MTEQQIKSLIALQQTLVIALADPSDDADWSVESLVNDLVDALYDFGMSPEGLALHYAMIRNIRMQQT